jgi:hypothetical protein
VNLIYRYDINKIILPCQLNYYLLFYYLQISTPQMQMHATILYMLHAHTTPHSLQLIVTSFFVFSTWVCNKMRARAIDWRWYGRNWCSLKWWERGREIRNGLFIILSYNKRDGRHMCVVLSIGKPWYVVTKTVDYGMPP